MTLEPKTDLIWTPLSLLQAAVANCQVLRMFQSLNKSGAEQNENIWSL